MTVSVTAMDVATAETVELLQAMIRNACVNDGTPESGHEVRSADVLRPTSRAAASTSSASSRRPAGRSVVARIEGTDPPRRRCCSWATPTSCRCRPPGGTRDPFGGELVDGEIWGRGAIDMLNLTASMAVAAKHLARRGLAAPRHARLPRRADEEAGGEHGADWLVQHELDAVGADYVITESGGWTVNGPAGPKVV